MEREIKIKNEDDGKMVIRKYHINVENSQYSNMDIVTIQYKVNKYTEKVKDMKDWNEDDKQCYVSEIKSIIKEFLLGDK